MSNSKIIPTVAVDILKNNNFSDVLNALASKDLDSLKISDGDNVATYKRMTSKQKLQLSSILHDMCINNLVDLAVDIFVNNSYLSLINALATNCLDSLIIKDNTNQKIYAILNDNEKKQLLSKLHCMCERKAKS